MIEVIHKNRGIIVDFFGDSVFAFFDPLGKPVETATRQAVRCGLDMQERMKRFNEEMLTGVQTCALPIWLKTNS